ncbi:MAG: hypothetical protein ACE5H8_03735 [Alphaproteobacteria bacterium]
MKIFLLWHRETELGRTLDPYSVASSLQKIFAPLFSTPLRALIRQNAVAAMVFVELPVKGWRPAFFQEDERTWAFCGDYPINARSVLSANNRRFRENDVLPTLGRSLEDDPGPLLREMAPPFSLVWSSQRTGETCVQNDALGQTQLFAYRDCRIWALTNKIAALKALGISPEPEPEQWAIRCTQGWFPLDMTGFKNTRFLGPSTRLRLDHGGVHESTYDVLSEWIHPESVSRDDCLELARTSLLSQIREVMPLWERPSAGLSGGWDSRAVVSSLRIMDADFSVRVKGQPGKYDVALARELARIAGLDLEVRGAYGLPPDQAEDLRRCISRALRWQTGYMWSEEHKSFLWEKGHLDGGVVNVMGQHGEIGRGVYEGKLKATGIDEDTYEDRLVAFLTKDVSTLLRKELLTRIGEIIRYAFRQSDQYDLGGPARLDFFHLFERTRRYNSASVSAQTGLVFSPFLNPDYIRATCAYRAGGGAFYERGTELNPFHRHIIAWNAPEWMNVPYERDLRRREKKKRRTRSVTPCTPRNAVSSEWRRAQGKDYYDYATYWQMVGKPIIDEALAKDGLWTEIFDPDLARAGWATAADEIAMLHLIPQAL